METNEFEVRPLDPGRQAELVVRFRGGSAEDHRLPLSELVKFGRNLETAVHRVALVLLGHSNSVQPGRRPVGIERSVALDVLPFEEGSFQIRLEQPPQAPSTLFNLGAEALSALVKGIGQMNSTDAPLPHGYDRGVLTAMRAAGASLADGVDSISLQFRAGSTYVTSDYAPEARRIIAERLKRNVTGVRTIDGQLLMGDFSPSSLRCRIHPPLSKAIVATFPQELHSKILAALTQYVRVTGETSATEGAITSMRIQDVRVLGSAEPYLPAIEAGAQQVLGWGDALSADSRTPPSLSEEPERPSILELIQQQGVKAIASREDLRGDFWPENESAEEFDSTIRTWRVDQKDDH